MIQIETIYFIGLMIFAACCGAVVGMFAAAMCHMLRIDEDCGVAMPKIKYGILDDFGDVIRWQWNKPSSNYRYITKRLNVDPVINWNDFEPALF